MCALGSYPARGSQALGVSTGASPREKNTAKEKVQLEYFESGVRSQLAELSSTGARPWYDATSSSCRATRTPGVARFRSRLLSLYSKPFFRFFFFIFVRFRNREGGCFPSSFFSFVSRDVQLPCFDWRSVALVFLFLF